jgi:hypothetical protein
MPSLILRPRRKYWLMQGPWGEHHLPDMPPSELYRRLSLELFGDAVHGRREVWPAILNSSWDVAGSRWIRDPALPTTG